jgi:excisionase family DNA binding protein
MSIHLEAGGKTAYLTEQQVAERLNVSVRTLRKWRLTGGGPRFRKFGSAVRYSLSDLEAYEEAAARMSTSDTGPES